jgi:hypothetical protein
VQVSHRRWYGHNGVQALVLTDQTLYPVRAGRYTLRAGVVLDKFLLTDLTDARWTPRGTRGAGRISFRLAGRCKSYASKWAETAELAQALTALQAAEQPQNGSSGSERLTRQRQEEVERQAERPAPPTTGRQDRSRS